MSFADTLAAARGADFGAVSGAAVTRALRAGAPSETDFRALLSAAAGARLEEMARRARALTLARFGRTISLYAPLYVANHCENECLYCGFRRSAGVERRKLSPAEAATEGRALAAAGIRHVLMLTGESRAETPVPYLRDCVAALREIFSSVAVEVYPLLEHEYALLAGDGADGLVLYQETYDEEVYRRLHLAGAKRDFRYRLDAPERACRAGMRAVTLGALLGLSDFRREVFCAGLHAAWLQRAFPGAEISVSLPRLRPQGGSFTAAAAVSDRELVQALTALRIFLPGAGITISTREPAEFRRNLIGLGVTRMSAASRTVVGGYTAQRGGGEQFAVADGSGVEQVKAMIRARGWEPVMKDWQTL